MPVKTFYIFGSGEYGDAATGVIPGAPVIAADGGLEALNARGIAPDLIVGDFDSYGGELPEGVRVIRRPVRKDETDMELAVGLALERGAERIVIYGGLGGRLDHTLANIQLLAGLARRGVRGYLAGPGETVTALCAGRARFTPDFRGVLSVFAYGGEAQITETGLLYGLHKAVLRDDRPLGVSNEFAGSPAEVTVHSGTAILLWSGAGSGFPEILEV